MGEFQLSIVSAVCNPRAGAIRTMNIKRLLPAILLGFVFVFVTDFLIHGLWLRGDYGASRTLWRGEKEMVDHMSWMMAGQFLLAATFCHRLGSRLRRARRAKVGLCVRTADGLFGQVYTLIMYSVMPLPPELACKVVSLRHCARCVAWRVDVVYVQAGRKTRKQVISKPSQSISTTSSP